MNITIIPDQHGERNWEKVYIISDSDYFVSLGDWFDSFNVPANEQMRNFKEYMDWVKQDPEHRLTCIGNHDLAYLMSSLDGMDVSGHNLKYHNQINKLLNENIEYLKPFVILDDIVFSHAGFSNSWIERYDIDLDDLETNWNTTTYHNLLMFNEPPDDIDITDEVSITGDNIWQSPLWIRPYSLIQDSYFPFQVVGHTELCEDSPAYIQHDDNKFIFCDSQKHNLITTINTSDIKDNSKFYFGSIEDYEIFESN